MKKSRFVVTLTVFTTVLFAFSGCDATPTAATQPALHFTNADSPLDVRNALRDFLTDPENQDCPVVANFAGFGTGVEHQPIGVLLFDASDEQIYLFRTTIADSPLLFFLPPPTLD